MKLCTRDQLKQSSDYGTGSLLFWCRIIAPSTVTAVLAAFL